MGPEQLLRLKVQLLTEGARFPESEWSGRRGGAGPVGGRYFLLPNGNPVGIPVRRGERAERFGSKVLVPTEDPKVWLYDNRVELEVVPRPQFYDGVTDDGIRYSQIALLHGKSTLATTAYQACRYWSDGKQCKFCTIPHSYSAGDTVLEKTPEQIAEVLQAALDEGIVENVLITTGTPDTPDAGSLRLVRIIEAIRNISDIPVAVQFEPPVREEYISVVARAGADAVGLHIESADEDVREEYCPGKTEYASLDMYRRSWQSALEYFGRGNVSTFILQGLGEDRDKTLSLIEELAGEGILPVVAPIRPSEKSQLADFIPTYVDSFEETIFFYKRVGQILVDHELNPAATAAGCHKCGGCTPNQEAYDWAEA
ncbi:radical SAM protein [Candidatus Thorarchaeota archaeon]|nr:MAG: radical SAM protein [Candidatus Thorarchaeota archaeon]